MRRILAFAAASLALAPTAQAATRGPVFGLRAVGNNARGYFVYTLGAGSSQSGAVIVSNVGNAAGTVKLFTADATTGRTTGTVYETDKQPTRAGSWVSLSLTSVTLAPGAHKRVPFIVHVPTGTPAGQWVGGIVAETSHPAAASKTKSKTSVQIRIRDLTIVAVQANVPGAPVVKFTIGNVTTGGSRGFQQVIVHFTNAGNVLTKPSGKISIFDASGKLVETLPFTMDTFLPQTSIDYPILLKRALAAGSYTALVTLRVVPTAGSPQTVTAKPSFSVSKENVKQVFTSASPTQAPPVASTSSGGSSNTVIAIGAAVIGLLVIALLLLVFQWRRRRPPAEPVAVEETAPPPVAVAEPPAAPVPTPPAVPSLPAAPVVPATPPAPAQTSRLAACTPYHYWEVAYDRGQLGGDGVWRFPHRCRNCGLELQATDIEDATAQADRLTPAG